jgi:hypothetical protein
LTAFDRTDRFRPEDHSVVPVRKGSLKMTVRLVSPKEVSASRVPPDIGDGNDIMVSWFLGGPRDKSGVPTVHLVDVRNPNPVLRTHFHDVDQFQLVMRGTGMLGKERVSPGSFHYVDAYTPYGPIEGDEDGIAFFTVRARGAQVTHYMPGSREFRLRRSMRAGFVCDVDLDDPSETEIAGPYSDGLAAFRRAFPDATEVQLTAPVESGGQIAFVLAGELAAGGETYAQWSCVYVPAGETLIGESVSQSLDLLVLQFAAAQSGDDPEQ